MASREITAPLLRVCFGAVHKKVTPNKILTWVLEEMASAQKDMDKTGDMDVHDYMAGMIDAYESVALWIAPLKQDKEQVFNAFFDKTGTRF